MKTVLLSLLLFSSHLVSAQDDKIMPSYLIGYWKHGRVLNETGQRVQVYVRTERDDKSSLGITNFKTNGSFEVIFSRLPSKCGNDYSGEP